MRACSFCDSSLIADSATQRIPSHSSSSGADPAAWRAELADRLQTYRSTRRRRQAPDPDQSKFAFEAEPDGATATVALAESAPPLEEDFSFTIAIGRPAKHDTRLVIDVSQPPESASIAAPASASHEFAPGLYPVASLDDRRIAALFDTGFLLFAYGAFLALFSSLGGEFTLSKLSAAVYTTSLAIVYLQYFFLFTVFGGTTPGMMLRGLQVVSFSGEPPAARQMMLRSFGYLLSAGTFFLGFLWSMWDEDSLTWHDRISQTYLSRAQTFADIETSTAPQSR